MYLSLNKVSIKVSYNGCADAFTDLRSNSIVVVINYQFKLMPRFAEYALESELLVA